MTTAIATPKRRKRCSECGELKEEVLGRQRLCEKCEQDKTYCRICDEWSTDPDCRHVGWSDEHGCCCGCGTWDIDAKDHKESFLVLLDKFSPLTCGYDEPKPLLPELLKLIEKNRFWTQWHGPLIGGYPDLALRYSVRGRDYCPELRDIRASEQLAWGEEAIEEMQLGMAWLTSLDSKTKEANKITAGWIREFLAAS